MKSLCALFKLEHRAGSGIGVRQFSNWTEEQNSLFDKEVERQRKKVGRIEKIQVSFHGRPANAVVSLNKNLSAPYDLARHMSEWLTKDGALSLVDNAEAWDMHRPLERDCQLRILTFSDTQATSKILNKVFWRSCSFLLGAVIQNAFRNDLPVYLHSFPSPRVTSGSFVYDAKVEGLDVWSPTQEELRNLSADMVRLSHSSLPLQRLRVDSTLALNIFSNNKFKQQQIPAISANSEDGKITLYRVGQHIDISKGPMISNSNFIGRVSVSSVHKVENDGVKLWRFQGVALPRGQLLNHFAFKILEDRAKMFNTCDVDYFDKRAEMKS